MTIHLTASHFAADTREPLHETTVGQLLREAAADARDRTALVEGDPDPSRRRRWTYAQLLAESEAAARALVQRFLPASMSQSGHQTGRSGCCSSSAPRSPG